MGFFVCFFKIFFVFCGFLKKKIFVFFILCVFGFLWGFFLNLFLFFVFFCFFCFCVFLFNSFYLFCVFKIFCFLCFFWFFCVFMFLMVF